MLRIANASAFWGDQPDAPARVLKAQPDLDYLTLDYLAEVSLSIMAAQRERNPQLGYARDFVGAVESLVPSWKAGSHCRIVTNAGGLNAEGCARAVLAVLATAGLERLRVAIVTGDDVLHHVRGNAALSHMETGEPINGIRDRVATANAYTGAAPIAEALKAGADIVITGRTADPSLTVGPCIAHYGWQPGDWNRIAGATVAGHLIECGTQVSGGFSTDWLEIENPDDLGFPVAEISEDGSCVITKPSGTGGAVTVQTVKEQLLYEIGDPGRYLSPDATVSFLTLAVAQDGPDRVRLSGATGGRPPETLKVSATYRDGYRAHGMVPIFGHDAVRKARRAGESVIKRLANAGFKYDRYLIECLGTGASVRGIVSRMSDTHLLETVLRISVADPSREAVERFTKEIAPLVTSGPQGVTGYAHGRPPVVPVFGYWPTLMPRALVRTSWKFVEGGAS